MAEIAVTELGYVGLGVSDLSRWRVFAGEVLGMECVEAGENLHLRMDYWNCRIRLHPDASDDLLYAGFRVTGPEEFRGMQRKLTRLGTPSCWTGPMIRSMKSAERTLRLLERFSGRRRPLTVQSAPRGRGGS
jgi:hypothetical protein